MITPNTTYQIWHGLTKRSVSDHNALQVYLRLIDRVRNGEKDPTEGSWYLITTTH